jgi:hypothetical protein
VYASGTGKWMHYYPGYGTSQSDIYLIFRNAYENINKIKIAKKLFQVTGLEPFNTGFFFLLMWIFVHQKSLVGPKEICKRTHPAELVRDYKCLCLSRRKQQMAASNNSLQNISPPEGSVEKAEGTRISPSNIFPLPKARAAIRRQGDRR